MGLLVVCLFLSYLVLIPYVLYVTLLSCICLAFLFDLKVSWPLSHNFKLKSLERDYSESIGIGLLLEIHDVNFVLSQGGDCSDPDDLPAVRWVSILCCYAPCTPHKVSQYCTNTCIPITRVQGLDVKCWHRTREHNVATPCTHSVTIDSCIMMSPCLGTSISCVWLCMCVYIT